MPPEDLRARFGPNPRTYRHDACHARIEYLEQVIRRLAIDDPMKTEYDAPVCVFCGPRYPGDHADDCSWVEARVWVLHLDA